MRIAGEKSSSLDQARGRIVLIVALFMGVRIYHLDTVPAHNETTDEYAWTWSGLTFFAEGQPTGWSNLKAALLRISPCRLLELPSNAPWEIIVPPM